MFVIIMSDSCGPFYLI